MTASDIATAVAELRRESSLPVDPLRRGPILLHRIFDEQNLQHFELPDLTRGSVIADLAAKGLAVDDTGDAAEPLDGFIITTRDRGFIYICRNARNILPRRRFSVAHEIGHYILHRRIMGRYRADAKIGDADTTDAMEVEANRFAAELLIPREVCWHRAEETRTQMKSCPRQVLAYRLTAELLVSHQAMRHRLDELEVGNE
ncbi:hypothetical protein BH11PLA2_BH11PLA2_50940 [soil metagenome]